MSYPDKLRRIDELQQTINGHGKLPDDVLKKVNYKFRLEWNYTSNSMEGNTLTKYETRTVMIGNVDVRNKPIRDILEMQGHDDVISQILKIGKAELNISESRIKEVHKSIMHEDDPSKKKFIGKWKTTNNYVENYKNERFDFVDHTEVSERMHQLINWLNTEKEKINRQAKDALHPVLLALKFHLDYIVIHPFYNGNGRTCRIFTNLILISYGYPPFYIKENEKNLYRQYLADIQGYGGDPDIFYEFMFGLLIRSQEIVLNAIEGKDIEEPDDIDKEINLLRIELSHLEDIPKNQYSDENVNIAIYSSIIPLFTFLDSKLTKLEDLFSKVEKVVESEGGTRNSLNGDLIIHGIPMNVAETGWLYIQSNVHVHGITKTIFRIKFEGFKKGGEEVRINLLLTVYFDEYTYCVRDFNDKEIVKKEYGNLLGDDKIEEITKLYTNEILERIRKVIGQD